ncbi:MAG: glycosyltransferase family 9 protein [Rhodoferax sp.]|nr:glycosyltransferase family 9 protein [Rhodoferax sp.]
MWKGNPRFENEANRSLPGLEVLVPLLHLGSQIEDFADTAAIVANLDLVICVDTAIAHLAGALGKPCWVLLPAYKTDWRWLDERTHSPWYPGVMRLFRQSAVGSWTGVVAGVQAALEQFVSDHQPAL